MPHGPRSITECLRPITEWSFINGYQNYTCEVISPGLLYLDYKDAMREGDGERVLCLYKYLMLIWKATGHKNYAIEPFTLLYISTTFCCLKI